MKVRPDISVEQIISDISLQVAQKYRAIADYLEENNLDLEASCKAIREFADETEAYAALMQVKDILQK